MAHFRARLLMGAAIVLSAIPQLQYVTVSAKPFPSLGQDVGVCDPNNPQNCLAPTAGGAMPISGNISGNVTATNPSVGATGAAVPGNATVIGFSNAGGNTTIPSATNPLPVTVSGGGNTTIIGPIGTGAPAVGVTTTLDTTDAAALQSIVTNTGTGHGGNVTVVGPIGTGAPAVGVTVTLDTTDAAALQSILGNVSSAIPAGTNIIGYVGGDGTAGTASSHVVTVQGVASMTKLLVTPDSVALPANQSVNLSQVSGTTTSVNNGTVDAGTQRVAIASNNTAFSVNPQVTSTTGASTKSIQAANNTTSIAVDASAGTLLSVRVFNNSATIAYAKFYNAAQGSTTCGSGTPINRIMIPASTSGAGAVFALGGGFGVAYGTAITVCITTGFGDSDTTAPAANAYIVEADYK